MNVRELFTDDDAVSPVIGVILMVAITVILAAVIGTFVLGLGDQVQNNAPQASFTFDYDTSQGASAASIDITDNGNPDDGVLTVTHDGGKAISPDRLEVKANPGGTAQGGSGNDIFTSGSDITAGSSDTVGVDSDAEVRVVWTSQGGGDSATIGKFSGPDA